MFEVGSSSTYYCYAFQSEQPCANRGPRAERQKRHQRGKEASYGRAVRRALAAATGAFIPIWIAKRLCGRHSKKARQQRSDEEYAKMEAQLVTADHSQSSLWYNPVADPDPEPVPSPAPAPARRPPSVVSALSSDSGRGRYERLEHSSQPATEEEAAAAAHRGLQRNPSLVSALSSSDGRSSYSGREIPPPTPMSDTLPTFTSPQAPPSARNGDGGAAAARRPVRYS